MNIFREYASFYDLYYESKDYEKEVDFVLALARRHGLEKPKSVLDIGCGTGNHVVPFCRRGHDVKGIDLSENMIGIARGKIAAAGVSTRARVEIGDATTYRDGMKYDLVTSMFAVMGYLGSNEDFIAGLRTARAHLDPGSVFIFDVWFGPAVLHAQPETRIQEYAKDGKKILRLVRPQLDVVHQWVSVDYQILVFEKGAFSGEIRETHRMRYFFAQELKFFLETAGFDLLEMCPFLESGAAVSLDTWNIAVAARAVSLRT